VGKGFYPQEDDALRDVMATFGRESGKQVERGFYPQESARRSSTRLDRPATRISTTTGSSWPGALSVLNDRLSIPDTLKTDRSASTTGTPGRSNGRPDGEAFPIEGFFHAEAWLGRYLDFTCEGYLPAMPKLLEDPFWLDPSDEIRSSSNRPVQDFSQSD
jgi:hypothetical protein